MMEYWSDGLSGQAITPALQYSQICSKLAAKDAALSACFFNADFDAADAGMREFFTDLAPDLTGDVFRQQLGAGVDKRQKNHVLSR